MISRSELYTMISAHHIFEKQIMYNINSLKGYKDDVLNSTMIQSKVFMIYILPFLWDRIIQTHQDIDKTIEILDVGPGSCSGSELLASLHTNTIIPHKLAVDCIDIVDNYSELRNLKHITIRDFYKKDIYDFNKKYDYVLCSNVIEHVDNPIDFCNRLVEIAKISVFITAPWNEKPIITVGHKHSFDENFIYNFKYITFNIYKSIAWGSRFNPPLEQFILELKGKAEFISSDKV